VFILAGQLISYMLALLFMLYSARYLGPADFGILSFALAFTSIFSVVGDFGLNTYLTKEVARDRSLTKEFFINIGLAKIALCLVMAALIAAVAHVLSRDPMTVIVVYLLGASVVINSFSQMCGAIYQAHEKLEYQGIYLVLNSLLLFAGMLAAINLNWNLVNIAYLYPVSAAVSLLYNLLIMRFKFVREISGQPGESGPDAGFIRQSLRKSIPFAFIVFFVATYGWADSVILSSIKGQTVLGWYSAAYRPVFMLSFLPLTLAMAIFPIMSRLAAAGSQTLVLAYEKSVKYLVIGGLPMAIGTMLLADRFIVLVYGSQYLESGAALQILIWTVLLTFPNAIYSVLLYAVNRQSVMVVISGAIVALNILLNLVFVPAFGYLASSFLRLATEAIQFALLFVIIYAGQLRNTFRMNISWILKIAVAGIVMGAFVMYFRYLNLALTVVAAAAIYIALVLLFRVFDEVDMRFIRELADLKPRNKL
jgi:O-antigen/teichoic acid export membrane protein